MANYQAGTVQGFTDAIALWEKALPQWQNQGNTQQMAVTLNFLASAYSNLGLFSQALKGYQQLLSLSQTLNDPQTEASTLVAIAKIETRLGNYQQALEHLNRAQGLWQKVNLKTGKVATFNELASVYWNLGDFKQANYHYNQALGLANNLGNSANIAAIYNNLGQINLELKEASKALDFYQKAIRLWDELIQKLGVNAGVDIYRGKAATLNNIASVQVILGQFPEALKNYRQALIIWQTIGDRTGEASTFNNLGFVDYQQGNLDKAQNYYQQALHIRQDVGDHPKEALSRYRIAMVEQKKDNYPQAIQQMDLAIKLIENLRTKVTNKDLRASFLASKQEYYQFYIELLMQLHQKYPDQQWDAKALEISERSKARSLLDLLAESPGRISSGISPELLTQKEQLQQQLETLEEQRVKLLSNDHTEEQKNAINNNIEKRLQQYQQVIDQIYAKNPRYAALTKPHPLRFAQIQKLLDKNTVLLEYALGEKNSYLWVVTQNSLQSYPLRDRKTIEDAVKAFRDSFLSPQKRIRRSLNQTTGNKLKKLILPEIKLLKNQRLLIVADGGLQYLPFAALPSELNTSETPKFLIENHEIVSLPSASTLGILRKETHARKPPAKLLAMLADPVFNINDERLKNIVSQTEQKLPPDLERSARESGVLFDRLPYTQAEAQGILSLIPANQRLQESGFAANRETATSQQLSQYRFIHFATHGLLNSQNPQLSGIVLSLLDSSGKPTNGFLRLYDIFNLNLPAELVVLSACQTGLGQEIKGEGLIGLTRGFMYAGAARVLVSLWNVDDQATSVLMIHFYRAILKDGLSPTAALRKAQLELQKNPNWSSPYYWAAFSLQGEWQKTKGF
ncbi:MAG: CHAT domain-containing tetratricopeptide repeat protein [Snowella sp.]|nr:CHAT domain-containing tetratricopeptide repeat protein [Snowella sp.]